MILLLRTKHTKGFDELQWPLDALSGNPPEVIGLVRQENTQRPDPRIMSNDNRFRCRSSAQPDEPSVNPTLQDGHQPFESGIDRVGTG